MKIQVFSDLHFDASPLTFEPKRHPDADIVVCAGDVCEGLDHAHRFLRSYLGTEKPILSIPGNHSFYKRSLRDEVRAAREEPGEGIVFLEDDTYVQDGVLFVGATLWTDYRLMGEAYAFGAMTVARELMNDHKRITWQKKPQWLRFRPQDALRLHKDSLSFIGRVLETEHDGPRVVVTHHAPTPFSIHHEHQTGGARDLINAAYASDLTDFIEEHQPDLWIHGHTHRSADYIIGKTRVICNPHGYGRENISEFNPQLLIEV